MKLRVLDLFSGIGGFSLGLERAGMQTQAFCEIDPYCRRVLAKHWPGVPIYDDIRTLTAARLAADGIIRAADVDDAMHRRHDDQGGGTAAEPGRDGPQDGLPRAPSSDGRGIDLVCGGFPCQDISSAGKGAGIDGERSGLWAEFVRLIGEIRPRYAIIENVSALLSGGDEYEFPNERCLCGWPYRWGGLHQHRAPERAGVLSPRGRGNGAQGLPSSRIATGDLRGLAHDDASGNGEMGGSAALAPVRPPAGKIPDGDFPASDSEAPAGGTCTGLAADDRLTSEEAEWLRFVDGGSDEESEGHSGADEGIEPQGAAASPVGGLVCPSCGRDMDHGATRSGIATWLGRILRDLAQIGFCSEFSCIPASAVGAPHRRDRIWIVAYPARDEQGRQEQRAERERAGICGQPEPVADAAGQPVDDEPDHGIGSERRGEQRLQVAPGRSRGHADVADAIGQGLEGRPRLAGYLAAELAAIERGGAGNGLSAIWQSEPPMGELVDGLSGELVRFAGRVATGVPNRVNKLRALGNSVVPQIPELIGRAILARQ